MYTFEEKTTLIGVSELRTKIDKILKEAKDHRVFIEKRNKLIAVLLDIEKYKEMEKVLDILEDFILSYLAEQRKKTHKLSSYKDIEEVEKMIF
jgi:prevent-host-death family protein